MCGIVGSASTVLLGAILVVTSSVISFVVVPYVVENIIISETVLLEDSIQLERFEEIPFPLNFTVRIFNLSNSQEYLNGAVPVVEEIGPYVYRLYQSREITGKDADTIRYRRHEYFEFDAVASYPNTEDDIVTIVNVPYHAIIQVAEVFYPNLASLLNLAMNGIFGELNSPVANYRVQDLLFNGSPICKNAGLIAGIACNIIRDIGATAQNLEEQDDGSILFSVLAYKQDKLSGEYKVHRGLDDPNKLGQIITFDQSPNFTYWPNDVLEMAEQEVEQLSVCNMINGTDAGIYRPLIDRSKHLYAINTDICRSVELRYEIDTEYQGIPAVRYAANDWLLNNDEGCFCLNVTSGLNRGDGCLLRGAMELYSCVGAFLVMSYPHFLFADDLYKNGVIGMNPKEDIHKILMDIEPNTGTPLRGYKRAQFNIFSRPIAGISATANLRTALVPILWIEEGISLPDEFVDELTNRLLKNLRLLDILIPILIAVCCFVTLLGIGLTIRAKCRKPDEPMIRNNDTETAAISKIGKTGVRTTQ